MMQKCHLCSASFSNKDGLSGHMYLVHQEHPIDSEILSCSSCQEWFTSLSALENHMMLVHKKDKSDAEKCPHCEKTYLTTAALLQHIICTHLKDQKDNDNYNCPFCSSKLKSISAFRDHIRLHFIKKSKGKSNIKPESDIKFKCPKCAVELETTDHLSSHLYSFHYRPKSYSKEIEKKTYSEVAEQKKTTVSKPTKSVLSKSRKSKKLAVADSLNTKENQKGQSSSESVSDIQEEQNLSAITKAAENLAVQDGLEISEETEDNSRNSYIEKEGNGSQNPSIDKPAPPADISHKKIIDWPSQNYEDFTGEGDSNILENRNRDVANDGEIDGSDEEDIDNPDIGDEAGEIQSDSSGSENLNPSRSKANKIRNNSVVSKQQTKTCELKRSPFTKKLAWENKSSKTMRKVVKKPRSDTNVECPHCRCVTFGSKSGLANHLKWVHKLATPQYICNVCNKSFPRNKNLQAHLRTHEKVATQRCPVCNALFITTELVDDHLVDVHKYSLDSVYLTFDTLAEFEDWKKKEETLTVSSFVKRNGTKKFADGRSVDRFSCHRSGNYIPMGKNRKKVKVIGTKKSGFYCPAKIKVESCPDGIFVTYLKLHLGHTHDLKRLILPREEKVNVEKKLAQNVPFNEILNEIRDDVLDDRSPRLKLLTKKDIYDIAQKYNLSREAMFGEFDAWLDEMRLTTNAIRAYKPVGSVHQDHKELDPKDFFLVVARDCQLSALSKFGKFVVCFDWIKAIYPSDIHLFTLTVIDDLKESYPCAFLYTNRSDGPPITVFFKIIRSFCNVKPKYFMSDLAEYFFDAWNSAFDGRKTRFLYCNWHLDSAWRLAMADLPHEKQVQIYKTLRILVAENDRDLFNSMCQRLMSELNQQEETKLFGTYFKRFVESPKPWAHCHRVSSHTRIFTTLENMHMVIKCLYIGTGKVLSPERSVNVLMKYLRDLHYERAYPFLPKRNQPLKCNSDHLYTNHKLISNQKVNIIYKSNKTWIVSLGKFPTRLYEVRLNKVDCNCQLVCRLCSFCVHYLRCACIESSINWVMCGHIHSVGRFLKAQGTDAIPEEVRGQDLEFTAAFDDSNVVVEVVIDDTLENSVVDSSEDVEISVPYSLDTSTCVTENNASGSVCLPDNPLETTQNTRNDIPNDDICLEQNSECNIVANVQSSSEVPVNEKDTAKHKKDLNHNTAVPLNSTVKNRESLKRDKTSKTKFLPNNKKLTSRQKNKNGVLTKKNSSELNNEFSTPLEQTRGLNKKISRKTKQSSKTIQNITHPKEIVQIKSEVLDKKKVSKHNRSLNNNIPAPLETASIKNDLAVKKKSLKRSQPNTSKVPEAGEPGVKKRNVMKNKSLVQHSLPNSIPKTAGPLEMPVNKRGVSKKEKSLKRISLPNKVSKEPVPLETTVNNRDLSKKEKSYKKDKLNRLKEQTFKKFAKLLQKIETQEELEILTKAIPADRLSDKSKHMPSAIRS